MSQSEAIDQVAMALAKAQGELENPAFDRENPHFRNKYASEAAVMTAIRPPLSKHGLAITHQTVNGMLITRLLHGSGQWLGTEWRLNATNGKPQERGSELTYGRRYNVCGLVGVVGDQDDDAELATKGNRHANKPEEFVEHDLQYDEQGNPLDNIPVIDTEGLEKLSKAMGRPEYAKLLADIKSAKGLAELELWGKLNAKRVATLPTDWQVHLRDEYRTMQISLGWKPKE